MLRKSLHAYIIIAVICLILALPNLPALAIDDSYDPDDSVVYFFTTISCIDCEKVERYLDGLPEHVDIPSTGNSLIVIRKMNIINPESLEMLHLLFSQYAVPESHQKVPIIFYTTGYLTGADEIVNNLTTALQSGNALGYTPMMVPNEHDAVVRLPEILTVLTAGILGGFNPCSISMLLLLISLLSSKKENILSLGIAYLAGKFIAYLTIGVTLFLLADFIVSSGFQSIQHVARFVIAGFAIVLAALNIWDFVNSRLEQYGSIKLQLPGSLRKFNHSLIERFLNKPRFLIFIVFSLGLIVSAGEFLCTGQVYLATILYQINVNPGNITAASFSLLLYCAASLIFPAILLVLCVRGKRAMILSETIRNRLPWIKLAYALFFIVAAVFLLLW
jgi:hypothetical protein